MQHTLLKLIQQQFGLQINETVLPLVEPRPIALPRSRYDTISWGCLLVQGVTTGLKGSSDAG